MTELQPEDLGRLLARSVPPDLPHPPDRLAEIGGRARRRRRGSRLAVAAGVVVTAVAVVLPALLLQGAPRREAMPAAEPPHRDDRAINCAAGGSLPGSGDRGQPLSGDFKPVAAYTCKQDERIIPGEGRWLVAFEQRADFGFDRLLTELRKPSGRPAPGRPRSSLGGCTANLQFPPYVVLVDRSGRTVHPKVPSDDCGHYPGTTAALAAMPWRTVKEVRLQQTDSPQALAAGCGMTSKDMFKWELDGHNVVPGAKKPVFAPTPTSIHVCVYAVPPGGNPDQSTFVTGGTIAAPGDVARLTTAIEAAPAAAPCTLPHTRFAELDVMPMHQAAYVEFDGCRRLETFVPVTFLAPASSVIDRVGAVRP